MKYLNLKKTFNYLTRLQNGERPSHHAEPLKHLIRFLEFLTDNADTSGLKITIGVRRETANQEIDLMIDSSPVLHLLYSEVA
jgi:hypothetical protein